MPEGLSLNEKAELLARHDRRNQDDYDADFYKALGTLKMPDLDDFEDKGRRTITRFIQDLTADVPARGFPPGSYLMIGFLKGFMAGRYLKANIFKEGKEPKLKNGNNNQ